MLDEFARFASDLQALKGEIVCKHYSPETILKVSNIQRSFDSPDEIQSALQLLQIDYFSFRVSVESDKLAMTDFAKQKNERVSWMQALGGLLTEAAPLLQGMPTLLPFVLEAVKWTMASFEGASDIEGVLDQAVQKTLQQLERQQAQGPQPDPKLQAAQLKAQSDQQKGQMDLQKEQFKAQADTRQTMLETQAHIAETRAETQSEVVQQEAQAKYNMLEKMNEHRLKLVENAHKHHQDMVKATLPKPVVSYKPRPNPRGGAK